MGIDRRWFHVGMLSTALSTASPGPDVPKGRIVEPLPEFTCKITGVEDVSLEEWRQRDRSQDVRAYHARIRNDSLLITVVLRGGCGRHAFRLIRQKQTTRKSHHNMRLVEKEPSDPCVESRMVTVGIACETLLAGRPEATRRSPATFAPVGAQAVQYSGPDDPDGELDWRAALCALVLSGQLRPPVELVMTIEADLARIEGEFGAMYPNILGLPCRVPWSPGGISLHVDDGTLEEIQDGRYSAWDSLNASIGVYDIQTRERFEVNTISLRFEDRLVHGIRLAELYEALPGVRDAAPFMTGGDGSYIKALAGGHERAYLFSYGSGDCLVGCMHREFYYFTFEGDHLRLDGPWIRGTGEYPSWWREMIHRHGLPEDWRGQ